MRAELIHKDWQSALALLEVDRLLTSIFSAWLPDAGSRY